MASKLAERSCRELSTLRCICRPSLPLVQPSSRRFLSATRRCEQQEDQQGADDYTLNVGRAISALQNDLPLFFDQGLADTSIYSNNIILYDPHYTGMHVEGKHVYIGVSNMLRWSLGLWFDDILFSVTKIRTYMENEEDGGDDMDGGGVTHFNAFQGFSSTLPSIIPGPSQSIELSHMSLPTSSILSSLQHNQRSLSTIPKSSDKIVRLYVRWKLEATPRTLLLLPDTSSTPSLPQNRSQYEGLFLYKFDQHGHVCEHRIESVVPSPSRRALTLHGLGSLWWRLRGALTRRRQPELGIPL
ncbi:hypothetical protein BZG36_03095 [Bifiguratus adelaidae]|uniref:Uncharacterized protein n=1 Tax=Bifiguratus adelaidae TaxID=1938954 RepID=A0A261XZ87_9FUNG|nr:hypothetical protein BZG36_03095 [Bifiguratus adelaidae]